MATSPLNIELQERVYRALLRCGVSMTADEITNCLNTPNKTTTVSAVRQSVKGMITRRVPRIERINTGDQIARYRAIEFRPRVKHASGIEFSVAQLLGQ